MPDLINPIFDNTSNIEVPNLQPTENIKAPGTLVELKNQLSNLPQDTMPFSDFSKAILAGGGEKSQVQQMMENDPLKGYIHDKKDSFNLDSFYEKDALRYKQNPRLWKDIGWNKYMPQEINDAIYDEAESTLESVANVFPKIWYNTKFAYKNYFAEYADGVKAIGKLDSEYLFNDLRFKENFEKNKELEELYPNYRTDKDYNWYNVFRGDWWEDATPSVGFTLGTLGAALTEEAVLAAATAGFGGAGAVANLPNAGRKIFSAISKYYSFKRAMGLVKTITSSKNLLKTAEASAHIWRLANGALSEAALEGASGKYEYLESYVDDFVAKHGYMPSASEMATAEAASNSIAKATIAWQTPFLMLSNAAQFGNIIFPKSMVQQLEKSAVGRAFAKASSGLGLGDDAATLGALGGQAVVQDSKKKLTQKLKGAAVGSLWEGTEEAYQGLVTKAATDYYDNKYFNADEASIFSSIGEGLDYAFSNEGLKEFMAGFVTGGIFQHARKPIDLLARPKVKKSTDPDAKKEYDLKWYNKTLGLGMQGVNKEKQKASLQKVADYLNANTISSLFQHQGLLDALKDKNTAYALSNFLEKNDMFNMENAQNIQLNRMLYAGLETGKLDLQIDKIAQFAEGGFEAVARTLNIDETQFPTEESKLAFINNIKEFANSMRSKSSEMEKIYSQHKDIYESERMDTMMAVNQATNEYNTLYNSLLKKYKAEELDQQPEFSREDTKALNDAIANMFGAQISFYAFEDTFKASVFAQVGMSDAARRSRKELSKLNDNNPQGINYRFLEELFTTPSREAMLEKMDLKLQTLQASLDIRQDVKTKNEVDKLTKQKEQLEKIKDVLEAEFFGEKQGDINAIAEMIMDFLYESSTNKGPKPSYKSILNYLKLQRSNQENLNLLNTLATFTNFEQRANYTSRKITDFLGEVAELAEKEAKAKAAEEDGKKAEQDAKDGKLTPFEEVKKPEDPKEEVPPPVVVPPAAEQNLNSAVTTSTKDKIEQLKDAITEVVVKYGIDNKEIQETEEDITLAEEEQTKILKDKSTNELLQIVVNAAPIINQYPEDRAKIDALVKDITESIKTDATPIANANPEPEVKTSTEETIATENDTTESEVEEKVKELEAERDEKIKKLEEEKVEIQKEIERIEKEQGKPKDENTLKKENLRKVIDSLPDDIIYGSHITNSGTAKAIYDSQFEYSLGTALQGTVGITSKESLYKILSELIDGNSPHRGYTSMFILGFPKSEFGESTSERRVGLDSIEDQMLDTYPEMASGKIPTKFNFGYFEDGVLTIPKKENSSITEETPIETQEETPAQKQEEKEAISAAIDETTTQEEKKILEEVAEENKAEGQTTEEFVSEKVKEELAKKPYNLKGDKKKTSRFRKIIKRIAAAIVAAYILLLTVGNPIANFLSRNNIVSIEKSSFILDLVGAPQEITEASFNSEQKEVILKGIRSAEAKGKDYVSYSDYASGAAGVRQQNATTKEEDEIIGASAELVVKRTLGQFSFKKVGRSYLITDKYNFNDRSEGSFSERISNTLEKAREETTTYRKIRGVASNFGSKNGKGADAIIILDAPAPVKEMGMGAPALLLLLGIRRKKENNEPITPNDIQALKDRLKEIDIEIEKIRSDYSQEIQRLRSLFVPEEAKPIAPIVSSSTYNSELLKNKIDNLPDDVYFITHLTTNNNAINIFNSALLMPAGNSATTGIVDKEGLRAVLNNLLEGKSPHRGYADVFIAEINKELLNKQSGKLLGDKLENYLDDNYIEDVAKTQLPSVLNLGYFTNGKLTTKYDVELTTVSNTIEDKKADIEKRKQEELDQYANDIIVKTELYEDGEGRKYLIHTLKNGKKRLDTANEEGKRTSTLDVYESSVPVENYIMGAKKISDIERQPTNQEKRINAIYDAELAALGTPTPTDDLLELLGDPKEEQRKLDEAKAELEKQKAAEKTDNTYPIKKYVQFIDEDGSLYKVTEIGSNEGSETFTLSLNTDSTSGILVPNMQSLETFKSNADNVLVSSFKYSNFNSQTTGFEVIKPAKVQKDKDGNLRVIEKGIVKGTYPIYNNSKKEPEKEPLPKSTESLLNEEALSYVEEAFQIGTQALDEGISFEEMVKQLNIYLNENVIDTTVDQGRASGLFVLPTALPKEITAKGTITTASKLYLQARFNFLQRISDSALESKKYKLVVFTDAKGLLKAKVVTAEGQVAKFNIEGKEDSAGVDVIFDLDTISYNSRSISKPRAVAAGVKINPLNLAIKNYSPHESFDGYANVDNELKAYVASAKEPVYASISLITQGQLPRPGVSNDLTSGTEEGSKRKSLLELTTLGHTNQRGTVVLIESKEQNTYLRPGSIVVPLKRSIADPKSTYEFVEFKSRKFKDLKDYEGNKNSSVKQRLKEMFEKGIKGQLPVAGYLSFVNSIIDRRKFMVLNLGTTILIIEKQKFVKYFKDLANAKSAFTADVISEEITSLTSIEDIMESEMNIDKIYENEDDSYFETAAISLDESITDILENYVNFVQSNITTSATPVKVSKEKEGYNRVNKRLVITIDKSFAEMKNEKLKEDIINPEQKNVEAPQPGGEFMKNDIKEEELENLISGLKEEC